MPTQSQTQSDQSIPKKGRGFAAMDQAKQREIASKGGKAAHESGRAHEFTSEEARAAGRKGGEAAHESGRAHEFTSEEARAAGRKGGEASHANRLSRAAAQAAANSGGNAGSTGSTGSPPRESRPAVESNLRDIPMRDMPVREPFKQTAPVSPEPLVQSDPLVLRESVKSPISPLPMPPEGLGFDKDKTN